jgi:hypothetical protein
MSLQRTMEMKSFKNGDTVPEKSIYVTTTIQTECLDSGKIEDVRIPCHKVFHHYLVPPTPRGQ